TRREASGTTVASPDSRLRPDAAAPFGPSPVAAPWAVAASLGRSSRFCSFRSSRLMDLTPRKRGQTHSVVKQARAGPGRPSAVFAYRLVTFLGTPAWRCAARRGHPGSSPCEQLSGAHARTTREEERAHGP